MELTIRATSPEEITLLSRAVAAALTGDLSHLGNETTPLPTSIVAQSVGDVGGKTSVIPEIVQEPSLEPRTEKSGTAEQAIPPAQTKPRRARGSKRDSVPEVSAIPVSPDAIATSDASAEYESVDAPEPASTVGNTETAVEAVKPVNISLKEFQDACVKKADSSEEMKEAVVALLRKFTTDGSVKTANVPEGRRAEFIEEMNKIEITKVPEGTAGTV